MSNNHYDTLESIFSIPDDVTALQKEDLIVNSMARIKGTIMTVFLALDNNEISIWKKEVKDCLSNIHEQLGQVEELINFEVKE